MLRSVSEYLRRCAYVMDLDAPRKAERNTTDINGDPIEENVDVAVPVAEVAQESVSMGPGAPRKPENALERSRDTAGPVQRAPRREHAHHREWNDGNRRRKMREYMQQYRGTGKVNHPKPQTGA